VFIEALINDRLMAFVSSLLFAVHPIHTEAVSFISNVSYMVATVFFMSSLILFLKHTQHRRLITYLFSLICFSVSLLTIESVIILPLIVICVDYIFLSRGDIKKLAKNFLRLHLGFFVVLGLYILARSYAIGWDFVKDNTSLGTNFISGTSSFWRAFTLLKIFVYYIRLLFLPYNLRVVHFFPPSNSLFEPVVIIGFALLSLFAAIAFRSIKRYPILSFSIFWFFITALPVNNVFPRLNIFAERYMYIPSIGFCMAIGFLFSRLLKKNIQTRFFNWRKSLYILFFLLVVAFGRVAYERNKVWEDDFTLWFDAVKKAPDSPGAHINLGKVYFELNLLDKALEENNLALQSQQPPVSFVSYYVLNNAGCIYFKKGLIDEASKAFKLAIDICPNKGRAYDNLAFVYGQKGQHQKAVETGLMAIEKNPYLDGAYYNLSLNYYELGLTDEAISMYEEYLKTHLDSPEIHIDIGNLYYEKGDYTNAKGYWSSALDVAKELSLKEEIQRKIDSLGTE